VYVYEFVCVEKVCEYVGYVSMCVYECGYVGVCVFLCGVVCLPACLCYGAHVEVRIHLSGIRSLFLCNLVLTIRYRACVASAFTT